VGGKPVGNDWGTCGTGKEIRSVSPESVEIIEGTEAVKYISMRKAILTIHTAILEVPNITSQVINTRQNIPDFFLSIVDVLLEPFI